MGLKPVASKTPLMLYQQCPTTAALRSFFIISKNLKLNSKIIDGYYTAARIGSIHEKKPEAENLVLPLATGM
jgi:hypothetical protein